MENKNVYLQSQSGAIHERAVRLASEHKKVERELVTILQVIDQKKLFRDFGFSSLYDYCTRYLKLSESVSYALISVSRKSMEVLALDQAVKSGTLTVSQA